MLCGMQAHDGPLTRLRKSHEQSVLDLLRKHGPLSRAELGTHSGLSRTTLYDIVAGLVDSGAVVTSTPQAEVRRRGRPVEKLSLNPDAGEAIGIDFARRAVHVSAVNVAHEMIGSASEAHASDLTWSQRADIAERLLGSLGGPAPGGTAGGGTVPEGTARGGAPAARTPRQGTLRLGSLSAIGVGVVGPIADPGGAGAHARSIEGLPGLLRERFGVPVLLDNNTRLAALAEAVWGAASDDGDVLYLRLSHGVGGGLVVGGSLHRGMYGMSGEFGHITVDPDGTPCECGGTGCLETVASLDAVLNRYRSAGGQAGDISAFLTAAASGDHTAHAVLERTGTDIGTVLAAVCNAVGPGVIVIGGELAQAGAALLEPVERALHTHVMPMARHRVRVRRASLGEAGSALGGIALALHETPLLSRYPQPVTEEHA
ncbi:ROK family transcriptional regulator [Streptomyces iconiensis]|uniref:ROK family transcriptional regulator n=1 Tax=Streptomyces iconiensis TaxID=1384038 RepID=A0ABT6ZV86_9ACTN|nr:ROK family transcriptional regulator [Streptomyces iconiensis]MDJ1132983.1 ROK family transcriptional regulator [Streptomyces iconiensis]